MKKVKFIRDYNGFKKEQVVEVNESESYFLLTNSIAVLSDCGSDCDDCDDCKGKKKKTQVKKTVKKSKTPTKK